jgi:type VI secretion system protein ImpF
MDEMKPTEKLLPCLLDRLTDNEPNKRKESRKDRVMNMHQYRNAVLRDIAWLLNTYANAELSGLDKYTELTSSVLNFGVRNVAGMTASSLSADEIEYQLTEALRHFEPRILPNTISIDMTVDPEEMSNRSLRFEIRGDLWSQPIPESLFIRTQLDIETGKVKLTRG